MMQTIVHEEWLQGLFSAELSTHGEQLISELRPRACGAVPRLDVALGRKILGISETFFAGGLELRLVLHGVVDPSLQG